MRPKELRSNLGDEQLMKNLITFEQAKKALSIAGSTIALLVIFDLMILFASLAQIQIEGRTGYWNPFWRAQAQVVLNLAR
jgi:hypothetical protein